MLSGLPEGLRVRHPVAKDHGRVLTVLDGWWRGVPAGRRAERRASLLPRLFFQHFADSSYIVEGREDRLVGFLIGFLSQSQPEVAYIHFVGVDPAVRRSGIAAALYAGFFAHAEARGAHEVRCITSPDNLTSVAFHTGLGFAIEPSDTTFNGLPVQADYDGPGLHRIAFVRRLGPT